MAKMRDFQKDMTIAKTAKLFEMIGRIHHDMFQQDKLLLNKVDTRITLSRSADEFCLLSSTKQEYKVVFKYF